MCQYNPYSLRFAAFDRLATLDYDGLARSARGVAPPHGALYLAVARGPFGPGVSRFATLKLDMFGSSTLLWGPAPRPPLFPEGGAWGIRPASPPLVRGSATVLI